MSATETVRGVRARHWGRLPDGRLQCDVCPRRCRLRDGQHGFCFVRARRGDEVVLTAYGASSGFCVDPIEKKPLYHFLPGTPVLSFGTAGCNLACRYCQNWQISTTRSLDTMVDTAQPETIADAATRLGCRSVAFTYNDPVVFLEYAVDVAAACHQRGVKAVAVTAGSVEPGAREDLFAHVDAANVDLKSFRADFYRKLCAGSLQTVLDTLAWLRRETDIWLELTTLVIPGHNDSPEELGEMARWVVDTLGPDVPMHFSAFHPDGRMRDVPPTPVDTLRRARDIARRTGVRYAYVGNVHAPDADATRCPSCGDVVIGRDWYEITAWNLTKDGRCASCGRPIAGIFEGPPGTWGPRRKPVRLGETPRWA